MFRKRMLAGAIAAVLIAFPVTGVYANDLMFKIDGLIQTWEDAPVTVDGHTLVCAEELAQILNASGTWDQKAKSTTIQKDDIILKMTEGKKEALHNETVKTMPVSPVVKDGKLMVPLRFVCETLGAKIAYDASAKAIAITTGEGLLRVMAVNQTHSVDAKQYTYDEAVKKVIATNSNLQTLDETIETLMESRQNTVAQYYDTAMSNNYYSGGSYDSAVLNIQTMRGLDTIERNAANVYHQQAIIKASLEMLLRSTLSNIAQNEMNELTLQSRIDLQTKNVNNLILKQSLGMASDNDVLTAKQTLEQYKTDLNLLQITMANDRKTLNKLLGEGHDQQVAVHFEPSIKPQTINVERHISIKRDEDPNAKIKKSNVEQAKLAIDTTFLEMYESKVKLENDHIAASRALSDYQKDLEAAIREAYNSIHQLEEQEKTLKVDLEKAKTTYNTVAANYQAGYVTMYEVTSAELGILSAEVALAKNSYNYWVLMYRFDNPFLLVTGS